METKTTGKQEPRLFETLVMSQPERQGSFMSLFGSSILHVLLILLAVIATSRVKKVIATDEQVTSLIPVPAKEEPPPPPPPPPTTPNTPPAPSVTEIPKGYQVLTVPTVIPPDIPPPTAGPEVSERDFSGEGVEGGRAYGKADVKVTAENIEAAPVFVPYTVKPELANRDEVVRVLERNYPPLLRDSGMGGTVLLWVLIDERGNVMKAVVKQSSTLEALDNAALKVADAMRFTPAMNRDQKVKVWIQFPIIFKIN